MVVPKKPDPVAKQATAATAAKPVAKPAAGAAPAAGAPAAPKKKLSLEISDVSAVLERKISP